MRDPRHAQIAVLGALLAWGALALDLEVRPGHAIAALAGTLITEAVAAALRRRNFDPRSPLISGLSLALLLRASDPLWAFAGGVLAIGSKHVIRVRGKHVFNPTNIALVVLVWTTESVWVSPGQWGTGVILAAALVGGGCWVLSSARGDVAVAFLAFHAALLFGRASWLGDPPAIPLHQLSNGALLIFALFMISDPRTLPDTRAGRILLAGLVAGAAYVGRFGFYEPDALLFALAVCAPLVPWIDRFLPGRRFEWPGASKETAHDPVDRSVDRVCAARGAELRV